MKSNLYALIAIVVTTLCPFSQSMGQEIAVCEVAPDQENWLETLKAEKKSELDLHIDFIHRVCELDANQLAKLKVASKMVVGKLLKIAEEQEQEIIDIEPALAIPNPEMADESDDSNGLENDSTDSGDPNETDSNEPDEANAATTDQFVQVANELAAVNEDIWADQEYLYGRSVTTYPDWLKKVDKVLTEKQKSKLEQANRDRLKRTLQSVIDRNTNRVANALYLTADQTEKFRALCQKKLHDQVAHEFKSNGQVYDYDGMLYSVTSAEEVSEFLNESQMNRWRIIAGNWQGGFGPGVFGGFGQLEVVPAFVDGEFEVIDD